MAIWEASMPYRNSKSELILTNHSDCKVEVCASNSSLCGDYCDVILYDHTVLSIISSGQVRRESQCCVACDVVTVVGSGNAISS